MVNVKDILTTAIQGQASDVHINVGMPPVLRRNTELIDMSFPIITNETAKQMVLDMVGPDRFEKFEAKRDLDGCRFKRSVRIRDAELCRGSGGLGQG